MPNVIEWWFSWPLRHKLLTKRDAWEDRLYQFALRYLPPGMMAHTMEVFIGVLCTFSGVGIATKISKPRAAEQFLPDELYSAWAGSLVIGGITLLVGVLSIQWVKPPLIFFVKRVAAYRLGLRVLSLGTLLYAIAQVNAGGLNAAPAALFTLFFSMTCAVRLLTLGREI